MASEPSSDDPSGGSSDGGQSSYEYYSSGGAAGSDGGNDSDSATGGSSDDSSDGTSSYEYYSSGGAASSDGGDDSSPTTGDSSDTTSDSISDNSSDGPDDALRPDSVQSSSDPSGSTTGDSSDGSSNGTSSYEYYSSGGAASSDNGDKSTDRPSDTPEDPHRPGQQSSEEPSAPPYATANRSDVNNQSSSSDNSSSSSDGTSSYEYYSSGGAASGVGGDNTPTGETPRGTRSRDSVRPQTPDRVGVNEDVEMQPVSSREDAADQFDRRLENFYVEQDQVTRSDDRWVLTESAQEDIERQQAAAELNDEYQNVIVGLGDVRETEDGYVVREGLRERESERQAVSRLDDDYAEADITTTDVDSTSDGMLRLDESTQREIATQRIVEESDQVGPDSRFDESDLQFDFEEGELVDVSISSEAQTETVDMSQEETSKSTADSDGFTWVEAGDEWPTNRSEAVSVGADLLTGDGAELINTDAPTNQREVSESIISARRKRLGIDIDPIDPGEAADSAVDRVSNAGREEGALVAAGLGVIVPEPSTTTAGAAILIGAAGAAVASAGSELDVGQPNQDVSEVEAGEQTVNEIEVADPDVEELAIGEFAPETSEVQVGDPTGTASEVDVPSVETQQAVAGSELLEETGEQGEDAYRDGPITIGEEDLEDTGPLVEIPEEEQQRQIREEHERRQEYVREDTTYDQVERDFPTGGDAVVDESVGMDVGEDVGTPVIEAGFELDDPTDTSVSTESGGLGDDVVGVGPDAWSGPVERSGLEEVSDVAVDTSVGNAPATAPMSVVFSTSPAQTFATPSPQGFGYDPMAGNAYSNPTPPPSRTQQRRPPSRPTIPGFDSAPEQPDPAGSSAVNIQITNPVATATDVLGVGSGMEMADSSPDAIPAEDDFEDEWPSDAGFGSFGGWAGGGEFTGGDFDGVSFDGASFGGTDMWDADNWEPDQGGQGDLFGGF